MEIRLLTKDDAHLFWSIRREALETEPDAFSESLAEHISMPVDKFAERLGSVRRTDFAMGAFEGGVLAGTSGFFRRTEGNTCHKGTIWGVYFRPQYRGKGLAKPLLQAVIDHARQQPGLEAITLAVSSGRPLARRLYSSLGFRRYAVEPRALKVNGQYVDEEWMELGLTLTP